MFVEVGKEGRIVLPKDIRDRNEIEEKTRVIIRERNGEIILTPVKRYSEPTAALTGSLPLTEPIDDPKELARRHAREKALKRLDPCDS
ncbi:MAG: AbrB/MazE/SpoVT family DNA-binding domain-containing protein [Candidatus Bathyarchaeota archaeon]|jgi:AbrB family looped-hinge helix DNA binding protein|nr:AbrB/MazE/SpoVT family DNA-binding domain-containing protein [Candidatus Bathyarchaeota archaeon]